MRKKIEKFLDERKNIIIGYFELIMYFCGAMIMINVLVIIYKYSKDISEFIAFIATKIGL